MFLEELNISRFRSCASTNVRFQKELTVLVGENNSGKSNIIDAIRLLTYPINGRRDRYPEIEDLTRGSTESDFTVEGHFSDLSSTQKGLLITAVPDPTHDKAIFGVRFQTKDKKSPRGRTTHWAGKFEDAEPEPGSTDLIRHVYLPPLRDAQRTLGSGASGSMINLLRHFIAGDEALEDEFVGHAQKAGAPHKVLTEINTEITSALDELTDGARPQKATLDFHIEELLDIARDLRFRLADAGIEPEDISRSGLGYANLLYISTVAVELEKAQQADLTVFLVEEPEAHLHPQLQMLVLEYLLDKAKESQKSKGQAGDPEGAIQVVVTTHSPNLTSWVSPKHLVVARSKAAGGTVSIPLSALNLKSEELDKVDRYLDVTKSAMLFGGRTLLVEGIAEAILIPVIAQSIVLKDNKTAWRRFKGSVIAPIDTVDFSPYIKILLGSVEGECVSDRVVVVTDGDNADDKGKTQGEARKATLEAQAAVLGQEKRLSVWINERTLEHELFKAGNDDVLKAAFLDQFPKSEHRWSNDVEVFQPECRADALIELMKDTNTRKGQFAQSIADQIKKGQKFKTPSYIEKAIKALVAE